MVGQTLKENKSPSQMFLPDKRKNVRDGHLDTAPPLCLSDKEEVESIVAKQDPEFLKFWF